MKTINPAIMINGETYYPKGYEFILGFALAGCQWAIDKADTPEFRAIIKVDLEKQTNKNIKSAIKHYENKINTLKERLT